jgi:hypothetical protein
MPRLAKLAGSWVLAILGVIASTFAHVFFAFCNVMALSQAFLLQGFEQTPLGDEPMIGWIADSMGIGGTSIAQAWAVALVSLINLLLIKLVGECFTIMRLLLDVRAIARQDATETLSEEEHAALADEQWAARHRMEESAIWFACLLPLAWFIVRWDVSLFSLRLEANVLNYHDLSHLGGAGTDPLTRLSEPLVHMMSVARWGYTGSVVAACFVTHLAVHHLGHRWLLLCDHLAALRDEGSAAAEEAYYADEEEFAG